MLFKIGDKVYDPKELPCAIVFANDEERQHVINILSGMQPKPGEVRWFAINPTAYFTPESFDKWAELSEEDAKLMTRNNKKPVIEL